MSPLAHDENVLLLSALSEPPRDIAVLADFVRTALLLLADEAAYDTASEGGRLGWAVWKGAVAGADVDALCTLLIAATDPDAFGEWESLDGDQVHALRVVQASGVQKHAEYRRWADIASDLLVFALGTPEDWDAYVRPAWWVFTDEVEYVQEKRPGNYYDVEGDQWIERPTDAGWLPAWPFVDTDTHDCGPLSAHGAEKLARYDAHFERANRKRRKR